METNLDRQTPPPTADAERCFHGKPLAAFQPVTEDVVKRYILKAPPKTCELDVFPTSYWNV